MHRSRVYEALSRLIGRGIVGRVEKNGVRYFQATGPEGIIDLLEEKRKNLAVLQEKVRDSMKDFQKSDILPDVCVLEGKDGFKSMRADVLRKGTDLYLIGAKGKENKILKYFFAQFDKERVKKNIRLYALFDPTLKGSVPPLQMMTYKFLPKGYETPTVVNVYGDRVVTVVWEGALPFCVMIKHHKIANSYKRWFKLLWQASNPLG